MLEELAADERHVVLEVAVGADRVDHRQAVAAADRHVVLAERGGLVHQPGAVLGGDVVGEHDEVRPPRTRLGAGNSTQLEGPLVLPALHVACPGPVRRPPSPRPATASTQRLGDDEGLGPVGGDDVGRPRGATATAVLETSVQGVVVQTSSARLARRSGPAGQREPDVDAGVGDGLVALRELVVGEPGAAARAVRRDAVVLDEQPLARGSA